MKARWRAVGRTFAVGVVLAGLGGLVGALLHPDDAAAQHTGGSFGGGHFGGGHTSGARYHVGFSHSSGRGGGDAGSGLATLLATFAVAVVLLLSKRGRAALGLRPPSTPTVRYVPPSPRLVDVSALVIGLDAAARPFAQKRLDDLQTDGDTSTAGVLHARLHETITVLRRAELAWMYVGVVNTRPLPPERADALFRETSADMRSRFPERSARGADAEPEGPRFAVVTVLVSGHCEIPDVAVATDRKQLLKLVRSIGCMSPHDLAALEIIWVPARDDDGMTRAELETAFPELHRLPSADEGGRRFCAYCSGPFARGLPRCPHCGAPTS